MLARGHCSGFTDGLLTRAFCGPTLYGSRHNYKDRLPLYNSARSVQRHKPCDAFNSIRPVRSRFAKVVKSQASMDGKMPKRKLGKTGMEVSVMGLGCSPLGGIYKEMDENKGIDIVQEAFKLGINFFDTSPFYGNTRSEQVLGKALPLLPRDQIYVATKCGRYDSGHDFSRQRVISSVKESLKRLQISYLDIVHCHDVEFVDIDVVVNEAIPALQELKKEGLVRNIGFSGLPLAIYKKVLDRLPENSVDVILSYCHCSLNDTSIDEILPYLKSKGVGVINASILSMGLLTVNGPADWNPAPQKIRDLCLKAAKNAQSKDVELPKLAVKFSVTHSQDVATHLIGCSSVEEVQNNVRNVLSAFESLSPKEKEVLEETKEILKPIQGQSWPSGLPENN